MNDFKEIVPFLKGELAELEKNEVCLSVESILDVFSDNGSEEADAAVREYIKTLIWPTVSDKVRLELCLRLRVAIWWIESLNDTSADGEPLDKFLMETMIEYWRDVGRYKWIYDHCVKLVRRVC